MQNSIKAFVKHVLVWADRNEDETEYYYMAMYRTLIMFFQNKERTLEMITELGTKANVEQLISNLSRRDDEETEDEDEDEDKATIDHHQIPIAFLLNDATIFSIDDRMFHTGCCLLENNQIMFNFWLSMCLKQNHYYIEKPSDIDHVTPGAVFYDRTVTNTWVYETTSMELTDQLHNNNTNHEITIRTCIKEDRDLSHVKTAIINLYMNQRVFHLEKTPSYIFDLFENVLKEPKSLKSFMLIHQ